MRLFLDEECATSILPSYKKEHKKTRKGTTPPSAVAVTGERNRSRMSATISPRSVLKSRIHIYTYIPTFAVQSLREWMDISTYGVTRQSYRVAWCTTVIPAESGPSKRVMDNPATSFNALLNEFIHKYLFFIQPYHRHTKKNIHTGRGSFKDSIRNLFIFL